MPLVSLVVCVHGQRELLNRLLGHCEGFQDELLVLHDGPDFSGTRTVVESRGGKFFEAPFEGQQEPHWPFLWSKARHNWLLRLDADEFPSDNMKAWLREFRQADEPDAQVSGFTCIWPLWDGRKQVTSNYPDGRIFLFHRERVRFFGMVEQTPIPDGRFEALPLVLHHQPVRCSHGLANVLLRKQAYVWRARIAESLLGHPNELACWRWDDSEWPLSWERFRRHPLRTMLSSVMISPLKALIRAFRSGVRPNLRYILNGSIHHALIAVQCWWLQRRRT